MDTLTTDNLLLRHQNAAMVEAEGLVQSWLEGVQHGQPPPASRSRDLDSKSHDFQSMSRRHVVGYQSLRHIPRASHAADPFRAGEDGRMGRPNTYQGGRSCWTDHLEGARIHERAGSPYDRGEGRKYVQPATESSFGAPNVLYLHSHSVPPRRSHAPKPATPLDRLNPAPDTPALLDFVPRLIPTAESEPRLSSPEPYPPPPRDVLSSLDWGGGCVEENARAVVDSLLTKSLLSAGRSATVKEDGGIDGRGRDVRSRDPHVTMEMRHKQVRERRRERDLLRAQSQQSKLTAREARREAEQLLRREEKEQRRRVAREEGEIREQMSAIRRQMKEERERRKILEGHLTSVASASQTPSHPPSHTPSHPPILSLPTSQLSLGDSEAVMRCAEECVREGERERRRAESRAALVKQLHEADGAEAKATLKLLHQIFSAWCAQLASTKGKLAKASTIASWRLQLRVWRAWRAFVEERRTRRERDTLAREMQREKRQFELASSHCTHRLLLRCFSSWEIHVRVGKAFGERERTTLQQRSKMAALLHVAATSAGGRSSGDGGEVVKGAREEGEGEGEGEGGAGQKKIKARRTGLGAPRETVSGKEVGARSRGDSVKRPEKRGRGTPTAVEPIIWQTVRQQLDMLLSEAAQRTALEQSRVGEREDGSDREIAAPRYTASPVRHHRQQEKESYSRSKNRHRGQEGKNKVRENKSSGSPPRDWEAGSEQLSSSCPPEPRRPAPHAAVGSTPAAPVAPCPAQPRPVTKPIPMSGMELRSTEIAQRREVREVRWRQQEAEKLARLEREAVERREEERQAKEAAAGKRREERRAAKLREIERQQREVYMAELTVKASRHYNTTLQRQSLQPWKKFVAEMRDCRERAVLMARRNVMRGALKYWKERMLQRVSKKEERADVFRRRVVLRRAVAAWQEYMRECRRLEGLAREARPLLLLRRIFAALRRAARAERMETWEKEQRAKMHMQRILKRKVLQSWQAFVPVSVAERVQEVRRTQLRRKVAAWLPDYQPRTAPQCSDD